MNATAQESQKLLTEAIQKQMIILGSEITLTKAHNVPGLTIAEDGTVTSLNGNVGEIITRFLEQFRELSAPLVKKTMQPLLSIVTAASSPSPTNTMPIALNQIPTVQNKK